MDHGRYMRRAIELAHRNPDVLFGCAIADRETGEVLAEEMAGRSSFGGFEVVAGVLEDECDALFEALARRMGGD